ncbi:MAG: DUF2189 domain-containing protein [Caldimonas sp.]|uniref:DUF2189 domain-containing protein n=1 Tax=Caldimonas sp. TaxID=2838790 RepID=UPI00391A05C5
MTTPSVVSGPLPAVRALEPLRALRWLAAGQRDLARALGLSLTHGLVVMLGAVAIALLGWRHFGVLAGGYTGFLLVAPLLATGLYQISRRLAQGAEPTWADVVQAWRLSGGLLRFALLLALIGTLWVGFSAVVVLAMAGEPWAGLQGFLSPRVLRAADFVQRGHLFLLWLLAGGLLAAWVFAISVVAIPMLLDRRVPLSLAVLASVRAVGHNPVTMVVWAGLIFAFTALGLLTLVGLVWCVPLLGHASWHAYTDLVDASAWPERR